MEEVADVGVVGERNAPGKVLVRDMSCLKAGFSLATTTSLRLLSSRVGCSSGNSRRRQRRQNKDTDSGLGRPWSGMKIGFALDSIVKILVE